MLKDNPKVGTIGDDFLFETGKPFVSTSVSALGISDERLATYRRLFNQVGIQRFDRVSDGSSQLQFTLWGSGFAGNTHHKGLIWSEGSLVSEDRRRYSRIQGNWYIFQD